ncbi:MAG: ABC transporter ATP-binding protein [Alphaproteobacteria bacterium]|jgi:peptide/nickel transport system ATP-binding protein|nr:ABC transporter ATP-binding protein [Alphaproteobacteria bacterium]
MTDTSDIPLLAIKDLTVEFKTRSGVVEALHEVGFEVHKREMVGVVGESGSGKSVTAYTVMGILDRAGRATGGSANFGGFEMIGARERDLRELRGREASMIFQSPRTALNPIRKVGAQIEDVLLQHTQVHHRDVKQKAIDLLAQVRILRPEQRYHAYPYELSGGMCQRVMIAIALACEPALLIADEPTTGLDVTTQKATMDIVRDLTSARNMAAILITHDLGLAARYCQRIVVMQSGEVVESAPTDVLFSDPQHPYTKKLIQATPRPDSRLEDLSDVAKDDERVSAATASTELEVEGEAPPLLEVRGLVKEYPLHETAERRRVMDRILRPNLTPSPSVFRAVDAIDFVVGSGESVGLVGESGCGKSTTSSMVTRLLDPTEGTILFDGEDIGAIPARKFARHPLRAAIQMVFQDPTESLNPRFSAFDAIAEPLRRLGAPMDRTSLAHTIEELATMVGLPTELLTRFPHQLSGGQKARVGIARAIALRPKLLILDEPTSALDVSVQAVVLLLLDRLRRELGMTYIFVSHDLNVVRLLCDRVIVMNEGRIVETGKASELLTNPKEDYTRALVEAIPHFGQSEGMPTLEGSVA